MLFGLTIICMISGSAKINNSLELCFRISVLWLCYQIITKTKILKAMLRDLVIRTPSSTFYPTNFLSFTYIDRTDNILWTWWKLYRGCNDRICTENLFLYRDPGIGMVKAYSVVLYRICCVFTSPFYIPMRAKFICDDDQKCLNIS